MPQNEKAKTAGKFVVIMLCFAILFFLLLPFLEDPAQVAAAQNKKATPQIFTSNPLSDLVRKVYAMFTKHAPKQYRAQSAQAPYNNDFLASAANAEDPLYAAAPIDAATPAAEESVSSRRGAAYFPEAYDNYGNAGFINEEGEWVLVRQTAPEAGPRGMHDVNSTDSAYDKWLQLERAAKYNPSLRPTHTIPESKWARLFRPIKNLFGISDTTEAEQKAASPRAFALASARNRRQSGNRYAGGNSARASLPNLPGANLPSSVNTGSGNINLADLLDPEGFIDEVADGLKEMAANNLDAKQRKDFNSMIDQQKEYHKQVMRQQLRQSIIADAQDQEPKELLDKTMLCTTGASSLYKQAPSSCSLNTPFTPKEELDQLKEKGQEQALENQKKSLNELSSLAGIPLKQEDLQMVVILGKTQDFQNPIQGNRSPFRIPDDATDEEIAQIEAENEKRQRQDQTLSEFYDYMIKQQGCDSQPCYWVATDAQEDPGLRFAIQSSGMEFKGDPLNINMRLNQGFSQEKANGSEEQAEQILTDLKEYGAYYIPYTQEDMAKLNQNNQSPAPNKKPEDPFAVYVPSAANAANMLEVLPNPGIVIYDNNAASILDLDGPAKTSAQRGDRIRDLIVKRAEYARSLIKEHTQEISQAGYSAILRNSNQAIRQQIEQEGLDNKDNLMGLTPIGH